MSRIPKIPVSTSALSSENKRITLKKSDENLVPKASVKRFNENLVPKASVKRFNENQIPSGKRNCLDFNNRPSSIVSRTFARSNIQPLNRNNAVSEQSKQSGFKGVSNLMTVRESMPAITNFTGLRSNTVATTGAKKTKRAGWDLKGRIQDMEENYQKTIKHNTDIRNELQQCTQRILALEYDNQNLLVNVESKSAETQEASLEIQKLKDELKHSCDEKKVLTEKYEEAKKDAISATSTIESLRVENERLKSSISSLTGIKMSLDVQLESSNMVSKQRLSKINALEAEILKLQEIKESLECKQREDETERRKLHNIVQELKGNIRVYCRMRPPNNEELKKGLQEAQIVPVTSKMLEVHQVPEVGTSNINTGGKSHPKFEFSFDHIFPPSASQNDVFHEISQLVQSCLDGYNVCIFAYGQTGSGKTYTMEGPENDIDFMRETDNKSGMIPRAVNQIFCQAANLESKGWKYTTEVSFLEVYNERIHDLLSNSSENKCEIKKSGGKGVDNLISNVTTTMVTSSEQVFSLLQTARISRAVATTKCNERSSRSHYIFQMKIVGENAITEEKCEGTLNLVDLAGSERIKESGSEGDRLQEAKYINKSLSNLGNVIMALSQKADHIPYRNSKLTHLLMNSLGGNSKTLMFVNISPDSKNLSETINSLRFATKVNQCNIGTAQKKFK